MCTTWKRMTTQSDLTSPWSISSGKLQHDAFKDLWFLILISFTSVCCLTIRTIFDEIEKLLFRAINKVIFLLLRALQPPNWLPQWHVGVRVESNKKLVSFIAAVPAEVCIYETWVARRYVCKTMRCVKDLLSSVSTQSIKCMQFIWQAKALVQEEAVGASEVPLCP